MTDWWPAAGDPSASEYRRPTVPAAPARNDGDEDFVFGEQSVLRQVGPNQSIAAIASFLLAHPYGTCGEEVEIGRLGRFIGLACEHCGEERVLEIVEEYPDNPGGEA